MPIRTFADSVTADLFRGARPAAFAPDVQGRARRKLQQLHVATSLADLRLPGNDLKKLHGEDNRYQLRINRKYRNRFTIESIVNEIRAGFRWVRCSACLKLRIFGHKTATTLLLKMRESEAPLSLRDVAAGDFHDE